MKFITKLLFATVVLFLFTSFASQSEATASSKIYREYKLPEDRTKFPITLTNGLVISSKVIGDTRIPVISKNNTTLWEGVLGTKNNTVRFSVNTNGDTFLVFKSIYLYEDAAQVVGISKDGTVFLEQELMLQDHRMDVDFITPSMLEIQFVGTSEVSSYFSTYYQLYRNGTMKEIPYVDAQFFKEAKTGKLKWVPGKIGAQFGTFKSKVDALPPIFKNKDTMLWYNNWQANYGFKYSNSKTIKNTQKLRSISKYHVLATRQQIGTQLRQHFGKPIEVYNSNNVFVYRYGQYTLMVIYYNDGKATFHLWDTATYKQYYKK